MFIKDRSSCCGGDVMSFGNTGKGFIAGFQVVENIIHGKQRDFHS